MEPVPRVVHLSQSDLDGGAARAAFRLHLALRGHGVDSTMRVADARSGDWTVQGPRNTRERMGARIRPFVGRLFADRLVTSSAALHWPAVAPTNWAAVLAREPAAIVHLHWVQKEFLSVADLGRLRAPVVWTLHDMWAFCGAEHYAEDERWRAGYRSDNRPAREAGFDLNRWTWRRKQRHWKQARQLVCPSRWLADCVRGSALMHDWPVKVIPNPLDTDFWHPVEKALARRLLGLPQDVPLLAFSAHGGSRDPRKGFALLREAAGIAHSSVPGLELVVCGQSAPREPDIPGVRTHYLGVLNDDIALRLAYCAADAIVVPSLLDNLPNSGVEGLACGRPVVAFDVGGLPDIVLHQQTGFLSPARDAAGLASGIHWVLSDLHRRSALGEAARRHAEATFSPAVVVPAMLDLYRDVSQANLPRHETE